jgi:capsular exopolysaccharide synthesis family protein
MEGKSLVASNFAIVTAQAGMRTLLVEADLRRPSVHKTFQMHSPVGVAAYLQAKVQSIDEIIHKTEIKDLDVVCCGAIPSNPSELISSSRMTDFIREAMKRYDRVVLDCPPISAVSDPLIVAAKSDGLIFVSKFNKIRREYAKRTVRRVEDAGIHILGAVINNIDFEGRDSYYYSQYYYQNRYYSSHYKTADQGVASKEKTPSA